MGVLAMTLVGMAATARAQISLAVYGQHYPHGQAAVRYIYGPEGMWRDQQGLTYTTNRYPVCAASEHPYDEHRLLIDAASSNMTAGDSTCVLLGDLNGNGQISDDAPSGYAFYEHSGHRTGGPPAEAPYRVFWFDDNWLARYMATAYGSTLPSGLHDHGQRIRWRQLGGDNTSWSMYPPSTYPDRLALNGIYEINAGRFSNALSYWTAVKDISHWTYNAADQRYDYPCLDPTQPCLSETYHLALWAILSERLLAASATFLARADVLQHAMSIRSHLLSQQVRKDGLRLGWQSSLLNSNSLMNTETISVSVLALGANAHWVLEPGYSPLKKAPNNYFMRPHNALSAVVGLSTPGHIVYGPSWTLARGVYDVDFSLRTPSNSEATLLATLDVYDGTSILASRVIPTTATPGNNQWQRYQLTVHIDNSANSTECRVYWHGQTDLDVGPIRVTRQ
jgi:hypothetical protein